MSEYGDYSQKIFHQSQRNSFRASSQYSGDYIDFNPNFGFNLCRTQNVEYQENHNKEKLDNVDTDYILKPKENNKNSEIQQRHLRKIETTKITQKSYLKTKRGSARETMELNINFKTIFCRLILQLASLKLLKKNEKDLFLKYKSESPSFKSLTKFLDSTQNKQSKQKLKELLSSSLIVINIQQSDLKMENKITMLKFLQIMRITIFQGNKTQRWKKISN